MTPRGYSDRGYSVLRAIESDPTEDAVRRFCLGTEERGDFEGMPLGDGNFWTPMAGWRRFE